MSIFSKDKLKEFGSEALKIGGEVAKNSYEVAKEKRAIKKESKKYPKVSTSVIDGLPVDTDGIVNVTCNSEEIIIEELKAKIVKQYVANTFRIKLENVLDIIVADKKEIVNQNKSVIGRGAAGALVFGPVGAMLGGMSALGAKQKKISAGKFLVISYRNKSGEIANITFKADGLTYSLVKVFCKEAKAIIVQNRGGLESGNDIEL